MKMRPVAATLMCLCCALAAIQAGAVTNDEWLALARAASNNADQSALAKLQQSAQTGDSAAEDYLGEYYQWAGNYAQADYWFQQSAVQGFANGENDLANNYQNGYGLPQDYGQSAQWYEKAAQQGNADAESNLGAAYYEGEGVQQSDTSAAYWLQKAAGGGSADGEFNLGNLYYDGRGEPKSYEWAAYWWQKARAQGSADAEQSLRGGAQFGPRLIVTNDSGQNITGVYFCAADNTGCVPNNNLLIEGGESSFIPPGVQDTMALTLPAMDYSSEEGLYYVVIETSDASYNYFHPFKNVVLNAYKESTFTYR